MQQRIKNDFYPTPSKLTKSLLSYFPVTGVVLEPCAGNDNISDVLCEEPLITTVITNDLHKNIRTNWNYDASLPNLYRVIGDVDYVVTNPPFSQPECQQILEHSWNKAIKGVAFLLRLSYLEPCGNRASFLKLHPLSKLIIFNPRPRFREDVKGSDNCTVAWFVWEKNRNVNSTEIIFETNWK